MLFFWVFAPAIEDVMGPARFTAFYLLGGVAASFAQIIVDPSSTVPNLGASGAIAAVTLAPAIAQLQVQVWVSS
jgi:membrane associated rhomboid family serine protease